MIHVIVVSLDFMIFECKLNIHFTGTVKLKLPANDMVFVLFVIPPTVQMIYGEFIIFIHGALSAYV